MFATDFAAMARQRGADVLAPGHEELDVSSEEKVNIAVEGYLPEVVVHTVGLAVDECETDPGKAAKIHVQGTAAVARACQRVGAALVNLSTCGLFGDDIRRFYSENDRVLLKTEYARSKFSAEEAARSNCEKTLNIRPGWLYGGTVSHKKNFVYQRFLEAGRSPVLKSAGDKYGCPTYTGDLSRRIFELLDAGKQGLYHVTNSGGGSRHDYVQAIVEAFSLRTRVEAVDSSHFPRPAKVPCSELLDNLNCREMGLEALDDWREALNRYVRRIRSELKV